MRPTRFALLIAWIALAAPTHGDAQSEAGPTLLFGGDVIFDDPIDYALRQMHRSRDDASSYDTLFEELQLDAADLTLVNLETPVAERTRSRGDGLDVPVFAAPRAFLEALAHAGVDAVTVANNHAYDQGVAGLAATLANADAIGVDVIGAGPDRRAAFDARVMQVRGRRIAIVSATEGLNLSAQSSEAESPRVALLDATMLEGALAAARPRSDLTVAVLHWTNADASDALPTDEMRAWCERAAEAGADLVVGHGPHVPGPREVVRTRDGREVVVLYSLGNLVAAMQAGHDEIALPRASVRDAVLASVRTRVGADGRLAIASVEARAFFISTSSRRLFGEDRPRFVRPLAIDAEIARAERAACGRECRELREAYVARGERIAMLFGERATSPSPSPSRSPSPSPSPSISRSRSPSLSPSPSSSLVDLGLSFPPHSSRELGHDHARALDVAERLRSDHALRVAIVAHPAPGESGELARRRGRRARELLSVLGATLGRFDLTVGEPDPNARVEIRLVSRRPPRSGRDAIASDY